jgi:hypothetical protein
LETAPVDPTEIVHLTSSVSMPVAISACAYLGVRTLIMLVAVFGREEWAERAIQVLKVLRRDREPK